MSRILGIDPGVNGAIVEMTPQGELIQIHDMPTLEDGAKGRRAINAPLLASIVFKSHAIKAFCELVGPRPGEGAVGAFGFGRSRGVIEGVLGACGVPVVMVAPPVWKRAAGIAAGKENKDSARQRRNRPLAEPSRAFRPQDGYRPGRGGFDRSRRPHAGGRPMSNVIILNVVRQARQIQEEKAKIVLASHVDEAFAEYHEYEDDEEFLAVLAEIRNDIDKAPAEMFSEYYWWATARRYARKNHIDTIGRDFYKSFNPQAHHGDALTWARTFLTQLPARYFFCVGGGR